MEKTLQNFALQFGIVAAMARILIDIIPKTLEFGPIAYYSTFFISFILEVVLIFYVLNKFKKINTNLNLKDSIKIGVIIMLIVGIFYSICSFVYDTYIDTEFQINTAVAWVEKFSPEQSESVREQMINEREESSPIGILIGILWFTFLGLIISLIAGSILKTKENTHA